MSKNKAAILNQNKDFRSLYYRGRSKVSPYLVVYVRKNKLGFNRIGITSGKKIGGAVQRNRCRRLIREAYRLLSPQIQGHWDIVFVARTRTVNATMQQVKNAMNDQFRALSLLPSTSLGGKNDENAVH